jgi:hypothetical protein
VSGPSRETVGSGSFGSFIGRHFRIEDEDHEANADLIVPDGNPGG